MHIKRNRNQNDANSRSPTYVHRKRMHESNLAGEAPLMQSNDGQITLLQEKSPSENPSLKYPYIKRDKDDPTFLQEK
jgi:hypothetical protein